MFSLTPSTSSLDSIDSSSNWKTIINQAINANQSSNSYKIVPYVKVLQKNYWNYSNCHQKLHMIRPDCLKILCLGKTQNDFGGFSVRAKSMMSNCGLFYFEVKVHQGRDLCIGFANNMMPLDECVGRCVGTFAYDSGGIFRSVGATSTKGVTPKFGAGDTIGCGVHLATGQLMYTKNGERLSTTNTSVRLNDLYPCVTLKNAGDMVEANFGPNFIYNFHQEPEDSNRKQKQK